MSSILNVKYINVPFQQLTGLGYVYFKKTGKVGRFSLLGWPTDTSQCSPQLGDNHH